LEDPRVEAGSPLAREEKEGRRMTVPSRGFGRSVSARRQRSVTLVAALVVSLLASLLLAGSALAAFRIQGKTSQRLRVSFNVLESFNGVQKFKIRFHAGCTSGATFNSELIRVGTIRLKVTNVDFRWSERQRPTLADEVVPDYSASNGRRLTFRIATWSIGMLPDNPDRIHGAFTFKTTVSDPATGQVIDTCATGRLTWKAHLV